MLIYLREGTVGVPSRQRDDGVASAEQARGRQWHDVGIGAQILRDLGIARIALLATGHRRYVGLSGFGIAIVATELLDGRRPEAGQLCRIRLNNMSCNLTEG